MKVINIYEEKDGLYVTSVTNPLVLGKCRCILNVLIFNQISVIEVSYEIAN